MAVTARLTAQPISVQLEPRQRAEIEKIADEQGISLARAMRDLIDTGLGRNAAMSTNDTLLAFSEWLDMQGVAKGEKESGDKRSHDQLAQDFIAQWEAGDVARTTLAGRA